MRTFTRTAVALIALAAGVLVANPAHAAGPAVLATGSVGGANVAVGDVVTSGLKSGTQARFVTSVGGSTGVFCNVSAFTGTVLTNPDAGGVATESLTAQTFSSCTSNIFGVTAVQSVTVNNLPYGTTVDSATGTVTVTGGTAPIQTTLAMGTLLGSITCVFQATNGSISGVASNTDNSITFTDQPFTKTSGSSLCPTSGFFTAKYAPVQDTSVAGSPSVFTN